MKKLKMLTSILLTLVLCLGFVMPAFAVESNRDNYDYSITVDNANPGHKYEAYQIFSADHTFKNGNDVLSNLEWGSAIVKKNADGTTVYDYSSALITELKKLTEFAGLADDASAETVVMLLNNKLDESDIIVKFSKTVGDFLKDKTDVEKTSSGTYKEATKEYEIVNLRPGYYVIIDNPADAEAGIEDGDAYSRYMVKVAGHARVTVKATKPTITKTTETNPIINYIAYDEVEDAETIAKLNAEGKLLKDSDGNIVKDKDGRYAVIDFKNGTAKTGDKINYKLTSAVPDMIGYTTYKFNVIDKLSKGLDFNPEDLRVKIGETTYVPTKASEYTDNGEFAIIYSYAPGTGSDAGKTVVTIEFKNMKKVGQPAGTPIIITYTATLNNEAQVVVDYYKNEAYLIYSNDPKGDGEGTTPPGGPGETNIWTIGIRLTKFGLDGETKIPLSGAQFLVYDKPESDESRKVIGIMVSAADGRVSLKEPTVTMVDGKPVYSLEEGAKDITLSEGTFYLKEIKAPDGYNLLKGELKLTLKAYSRVEGGVTIITWHPTIEAVNPSDKDLAGAVSSTDTIGEGEDAKTVSVIDLQIQNKDGFQLPSTGGIGTIIFTVIGVLVMGAVIVIAIKSNKK